MEVSAEEVNVRGLTEELVEGVLERGPYISSAREGRIRGFIDESLRDALDPEPELTFDEGQAVDNARRVWAEQGVSRGAAEKKAKSLSEDLITSRGTIGTWGGGGKEYKIEAPSRTHRKVWVLAGLLEASS